MSPRPRPFRPPVLPRAAALPLPPRRPRPRSRPRSRPRIKGSLGPEARPPSALGRARDDRQTGEGFFELICADAEISSGEEDDSNPTGNIPTLVDMQSLGELSPPLSGPCRTSSSRSSTRFAFPVLLYDDDDGGDALPHSVGDAEMWGVQGGGVGAAAGPRHPLLGGGQRKRGRRRVEGGRRASGLQVRFFEPKV